MRRFLVVGCGGSGGATLSYMMDQLRSELGAYGFGLPRGWQFVHIDVPTGADAPPDGLGRVADQGGRYVPTGPSGSSYGALDSAVTPQGGVLDAIATWAPRAPDLVPVPIDQGAGQYRALGRMITITRASEILQRLRTAFEELNRDEAAAELATMNDVPGMDPFSDREEVIVLVVSSMAGGAGASMALDVCRILTLVDGIVPGRIGVFMYSADVFDRLPKSSRMGVRGNSLAMFGEILAAQVGAAGSHDQSLLSSVGLSVGIDRIAPFARVFPISRRVGMNHAPFGDGEPKTVYRGVARGLAALMMSGQASFQFVVYDLTNSHPIPAAQSSFGWGADSSAIAWGGFGYACLSTGRDRFSEYAAQRIASGAVTRLVKGHEEFGGGDASGIEQIRSLLDSQWSGVCQRLQLPINEAGFFDWVQGAVFPTSEADARAVASAEIEPFVAPPVGGQSGPDYIGQLRQDLSRRRDQVRAGAERAAYNRAYAWLEELANRVRLETGDAVSRFGLSYALAMLERLDALLRNVVMPQASAGVQFAPADVVAVPPESEGLLAGIRGAIVNGHQILSSALLSLLAPVRGHLLSHGCRLIEQSVPEFVMTFLTPLRDATAASLQFIEMARDPKNQVQLDAGLARLKTDNCLAWPADGDLQVPERFTHALNEVLLIKASDFDGAYRDLLVKSVESAQGRHSFAATEHLSTDASFHETRREVWREIIAGDWETSGAERAPRNLIEQTRIWRSTVFNHHPATDERFVPQPAAFDIHARPAELLARARSYVERPDTSFHTFAHASLRHLLTGQGTEAERQQRSREMLAAFTEVLGRARPMISVHRGAVGQIHAPETVSYRYKFSTVPFLGVPIVDQMQAALSHNDDIDQVSDQSFAGALKGDDGVSRIDVFGSYANLSPVTFDAVLTPAADEWAATPPPGRAGYWRWRRSRPLPAALPLSDVERRAMVSGWFVGQMIGEIRFPPLPYDHLTEGAEIWDAENGRWTRFPHPMLTPPDQFIAEYDWLPAVLESVLIAVAAATKEPLFASMRPYLLLRRLFDESPESPTARTGHTQLAGERRLSEWLRRGKTAPAGRPGSAGTAESAEDRMKSAADWLERINALACNEYLPPREGGRGGGKFSTITQRRQASATPMFRDLAPDVYAATLDLQNILIQAYAQATQEAPPSTQWGQDGRDTGFEPPSAGVSF